MKRLVYETTEKTDLREVAEMLGQAHLSGWRCRVFGADQAAIDRSGLRVLPATRRSAMLGYAWRGGFWGGALGLLLALFLLADSQFIEPEWRRAALYSLLVSGGFFGAWVGGLLGMAKLHAQLAPFIDRVAEQGFLFFLDVPDVDERLARKVMGMCRVDAIAGFRRRWWQYAPLPEPVPPGGGHG